MIYQIDPAMFLDSNGDGWGDLGGIAARLEHIRGLGANCIWLLPFYRSPYRDGGYDVSDHLSVDPRYGDIADFAMLMDKADSLGLRVLVDLVVQHTSVDHPWFQAARSDPQSPYRDYYVWADRPHDTDVRPVFETVEDDVWTWDDEAQAYYRHVFYRHEPDLNLGNPRVRDEIRRIMGFWLRLGVSGFRVDAVPYMVERARAADPRDNGYWLLEEMREFISLRRPEGILLGEVDVPVEAYADYFGDSNRMTMLLNFWANNHLFLALARKRAEPLTRTLDRLPQPPPRAQYANFARNHDELDLERLTEDEQREVLARFAPDESMHAYNRGIRRRLAPMLDGDDRAVAMAHAVLMSLPGAPVLLYGDEIGMGDDLNRPERRSVRTPMQWSDAPNGGFSGASPGGLVASVISEGQYGFRNVNVYSQVLRPDSLLAKVGNLVRTRLGATEVGAGDCRPLPTTSPAVLALLHEGGGRRLVTLVNLSDEDVTFEIEDAELDDPVDVLADQGYPPPSGRPLKGELASYGYRWLRSRQELY